MKDPVVHVTDQDGGALCRSSAMPSHLAPPVASNCRRCDRLVMKMMDLIYSIARGDTRDPPKACAKLCRRLGFEVEEVTTCSNG
jgi:hypothetical protein